MIAHVPSKMGFAIVTCLILISASVGQTKEARPLKKRSQDEKESSALKNAIEFYNLTMNMEEKVTYHSSCSELTSAKL
jgi:hypothetical protein